MLCGWGSLINRSAIYQNPAFFCSPPYTFWVSTQRRCEASLQPNPRCTLNDVHWILVGTQVLLLKGPWRDFSRRELGLLGTGHRALIEREVILRNEHIRQLLFKNKHVSVEQLDTQTHIFMCINSQCLSSFWTLLSHIHFYEVVVKLGNRKGEEKGKAFPGTC